MNPFLHLPQKTRNDEPGKQALVIIQETPHYTNEGSEFLDDAIRFKDQPLTYSEVVVTAGSPEYVL